MLAPSTLAIFGPCAVAVAAAARLVGERVVSSHVLTEPLQHVVATDFSTVNIGQDAAWRLQLDQVDDWIDQDSTGDYSGQLRVLSLVRESSDAPKTKLDISMCVVAFEGQPTSAKAVQARAGDEACGLYDQCISDIKLQAASSSGCSFDLPSSCKASSNREWQRFDSEVVTSDTARIFAITSKRTRGNSQEARPLLVVTHSYSDDNALSGRNRVETHCLVPKPVEGQTNARIELKKRGPGPDQSQRVAEQVKTSDEDGKAAADTAQVSVIVAAAALITAMLLSF